MRKVLRISVWWLGVYRAGLWPHRCHAGLEFICADLGYRHPEPITKEEHESEERRRLTAALEGVMAQLAAFNRRTGVA